MITTLKTNQSFIKPLCRSFLTPITQKSIQIFFQSTPHNNFHSNSSLGAQSQPTRASSTPTPLQPSSPSPPRLAHSKLKPRPSAPRTFTPSIVPNIHPAADTRSYPVRVAFRVNRTQSHQIPVYTSYRNAGSRIETEIRKIEGDIGAFAKEVQILLGPQVEVQQRIGIVSVKGDYAGLIKKWLTTLGF
jgi:hypothetical protein